VIAFTLTPADLAAYYALQARESGEEESRLKGTRLAGAWLAGGAAYLAAFLVSALPLLLARQLLLATLLELVDIGVGLAVGWWEWRRGRVAHALLVRRYRLKARVALERGPAQRRLWLDDDGLHVASGDRSARVAWPAITRISETDDHVFVHTGEVAHVIPRRAGAGVAGLVEGIRSRTGL
jgi:hypothetical protein